MAACHAFDFPGTRLIGTRGVNMLKSWPPNTQIVSPAGVLDGTWTWMVMVAVGSWACASRRTAAKPMMMYMSRLIGVGKIRNDGLPQTPRWRGPALAATFPGLGLQPARVQYNLTGRDSGKRSIQERSSQRGSVASTRFAPSEGASLYLTARVRQAGIHVRTAPESSLSFSNGKRTTRSHN